MRPKRILVLFPNLWDKRHLSDARHQGKYEFVFHDRELWSFPLGFLRILGFDPVAYIDEVVKRCERLRIDGVISTDEYIGSIIAAAVSQRLGLPGHDPRVVIQTTHKYYARIAQEQIAPSAVPNFQLLSCPAPPRSEIELPYPVFVKPVRGSFSLFSARCASYPALRSHLDLNQLWRFAIRRVLRPFNDLLHHFTEFSVDVNRFIGEAFMPGHQVCIDGFVHDGEVFFLGVVDANFFPGTHAFERFSYPSTLPMDVKDRMLALAEKMVRGLGIQHGQFNVELIYDRERDTLQLIEVHPRISYQFADLYADVDGANTYDLMLALAVGEPPKLPRAEGRHKHAASLVIRKFAGRRVRRVPCRATVNAFRSRYPDARVEIFAKEGSMNPEMRAMGSYRCALINVGVGSLAELRSVRADADAMLQFEVV